jgi:hypothetical protein
MVFQVSMYPNIHDIQVSTYPSIHLSKYPKKCSIQDIQVSGYQKKVVSTHTYSRVVQICSCPLKLIN